MVFKLTLKEKEMEYPVTENLVGVELRKSYPGYKSNFGNRSYEIKNKGAKDNQLELLKKFGPAELSHQHPETLEWIVEFEYQTVNNNPTETPICFFRNKEDAIAFVDFHNSTLKEII